MCLDQMHVNGIDMQNAYGCKVHGILLCAAMNKMDTTLPRTGAPASGVARDSECYRREGFSPRAADAIVRIDATMTRIRRAMTRREHVTELLAEIDPALDASKLDVIGAVLQWSHDGSAPLDEVTVGTVAERLGIDPSRASRLVADVVDLGYVRRSASQSDSRRTVLEPTDKAVTFGSEFRARKTSMLTRGLKTWTEDELVQFADLVDRFSYWGKAGLEPRSGPKGSAAR